MRALTGWGGWQVPKRHLSPLLTGTSYSVPLPNHSVPVPYCELRVASSTQEQYSCLSDSVVNSSYQAFNVALTNLTSVPARPGDHLRCPSQVSNLGSSHTVLNSEACRLTAQDVSRREKNVLRYIFRVCLLQETTGSFLTRAPCQLYLDLQGRLSKEPHPVHSRHRTTHGICYKLFSSRCQLTYKLALLRGSNTRPRLCRSANGVQAQVLRLNASKRLVSSSNSLGALPSPAPAAAVGMLSSASQTVRPVCWHIWHLQISGMCFSVKAIICQSCSPSDDDSTVLQMQAWHR